VRARITTRSSLVCDNIVILLSYTDSRCTHKLWAFYIIRLYLYYARVYKLEFYGSFSERVRSRRPFKTLIWFILWRAPHIIYTYFSLQYSCLNRIGVCVCVCVREGSSEWDVSVRCPSSNFSKLDFVSQYKIHKVVSNSILQERVFLFPQFIDLMHHIWTRSFISSGQKV